MSPHEARTGGATGRGVWAAGSALAQGRDSKGCESAMRGIASHGANVLLLLRVMPVGH